MPTKEIFEKIRSKVLRDLGNNLAKDLLYHSVQHTIDVAEQAERIALNEKIVSTNDLFLLQCACLYHDIGFLVTYHDHEEAGCELAKKELPFFGVSPGQVDMICALIRATKLPQNPLTKLAQIICDADLDYLGRDDFFSISHDLFLELRSRGYIDSENDWNVVQIKFFKEHQYFTQTNKKLREQKKSRHLEMIEAMVVYE